MPLHAGGGQEPANDVALHGQLARQLGELERETARLKQRVRSMNTPPQS